MRTKMRTKITVDSVELPAGRKAWQVKGNGKTFFSQEEVSKNLEGRTVEIEYQENEFCGKKYLWIQGLDAGDPSESKIEQKENTTNPGNTPEVLACNIATALTCKIIENQKDITVERSVVVWRYFKEEILNSMKIA